MSRRIALLAAMPRELAPLVKVWGKQALPGHVQLWSKTDADGDTVVAACAGMGADAVRRAFAAAEAGGPLDLVISLGLAGATGVDGHVGDVAVLSEVVDVQTGERFALGTGERRQILATVVRTADASEKRRLAATYGAAMVDMEAATVARLAAMRELPMCCFKAVSDAAEAVLPEIDPFVDGEGQLQIARFAGYLAMHPRFWRPVKELARGSQVASAALARSVQAFLLHKDAAYTNRTGRFSK